MRFAKKHRDSSRLPLFLFCLFFFDAFIMVIPSLFCLVAAVTISPRRWRLFALLATLASTASNAVTFILGYCLPFESIEGVISRLHLSHIWEMAHDALARYGLIAGFIGALTTLPSQMITAILGMSVRRSESVAAPASAFFEIIALVFLGHLIKTVSLAALTRFGWVRLEKKYGSNT